MYIDIWNLASKYSKKSLIRRYTKRNYGKQRLRYSINNLYIVDFYNLVT